MRREFSSVSVGGTRWRLTFILTGPLVSSGGSRLFTIDQVHREALHLVGCR